jgi:pimeloyl-ACP methyl ester carboxylesterase
MKKIVVVTGLGDDGKPTALATTGWKKQGLAPIIFVPRWDNNEGVAPKLTKLRKLIDRESKGEKIFLLGISAGASLAMNAFIKRPNKVEKMVSVCGRLRLGWSRDKISRKLQEETLKHLAFKESVEMVEKNIEKLTEGDRKRILTISARLGDELIPLSTSQLAGAKNVFVSGLGHVLAIASAMTVEFEEIRRFLEE